MPTIQVDWEDTDIDGDVEMSDKESQGSDTTSQGEVGGDGNPTQEGEQNSADWSNGNDKQNRPGSPIGNQTAKKIKHHVDWMSDTSSKGQEGQDAEETEKSDIKFLTELGQAEIDARFKESQNCSETKSFQKLVGASPAILRPLLNAMISGKETSKFEVVGPFNLTKTELMEGWQRKVSKLRCYGYQLRISNASKAYRAVKNDKALTMPTSEFELIHHPTNKAEKYMNDWMDWAKEKLTQYVAA